MKGGGLLPARPSSASLPATAGELLRQRPGVRGARGASAPAGGAGRWGGPAAAGQPGELLASSSPAVDCITSPLTGTARCHCGEVARTATASGGSGEAWPAANALVERCPARAPSRSRDQPSEAMWCTVTSSTSSSRSASLSTCSARSTGPLAPGRTAAVPRPRSARRKLLLAVRGPAGPGAPRSPARPARGGRPPGPVPPPARRTGCACTS